MKQLKNNILILLLIMASFVLAFRYDASDHRILYDDMSISSNVSTSTSPYFCANIESSCYYHFDTTLNKLAKRSTTDGTLITSVSTPAVLAPLFVDGNDRVWCIRATFDKYVYVYESDLSSYSTYTLKAGNNLNDKISYIALTWDSNYAYLVSENTDCVEKYEIANIDGGDPEWSTDLSGYGPYLCVVDEEDNVYTGPNGSGGIEMVKLNSSGVKQYDDKPASRLIAYCQSTGRIFAPTYAHFSESTNSIQYDKNGNVIGKSATWRFSYCFSVGYNEDYVYGGSVYDSVTPSDNGIHRYPLTDWSTPETRDEIAQIADKKNYAWFGDTTGYIYKKLASYAAEGIVQSHPVWERRFGIGQETDWGTGVNSEIPIPVINYPDFNINRVTIESNHFSGLAYNNLVQRQRSYDAPKIQISFDAVNDYLVYFFYTLFQRVWESGSSPYPKTFIPYNESPDFSAKSSSLSPPLLSIIGDNRVNNEGHKIDGALCSNLKLEGEEGQILKTIVDLQGRNMITNDSSGGDDFTSYSNETPLLWENAIILMARSGATAETQGIFSITSADDSQVVVSGDQTSYISNGNYLTFGITIASSNDTIVITETTGSTVAVTVTQGVYHPIELCLELQSKINQSADLANQYKVTFDIISRKFLFTRDSGSDTFIVDEENGSMEMNGTLGFDGSNDVADTSYESDNAITWNVKAYEITNVAYSSSTTMTVALDRDPTEGTLPQSVLIWRKINAFSMNLDFANNVKSPVRNNTVVRQHILGKFEGKGSLTIPWGLYSNDENLEINNFIAGYRTPLWIYFGGFGETDNDLAIFLNSFYTGSREISDNIIELELPFEATRDFDSNQINLPCFAVISDGDDKSWSCDLLLL